MLEWFASVFASAWGVLTPGRASVPSLDIAIGIAFLAGVSTLLDHGAVLYINRVRGLRAAAALALSGVLLVLLYVAHAFVLFLVAPLIIGHREPLTLVIALTLASTAPLILSVFGFVPILGIVFTKFLNAWSFVALWTLVLGAYSTTWLRALIVSGAAWLVMNLLSDLIGPVISRGTARIWRLVTGVPTQITARDILAGTPIIPISAEPAEAASE